MESRRIGRRSIPTSGARWRRLPFPGIRECAMTTSGSRIFARELSRSGIGFGCGGRGEKSEREWEEDHTGLAGVTAIPALAARGGNAYSLHAKSKQQRGLSTAFGCRLTPLKMTVRV